MEDRCSIDILSNNYFTMSRRGYRWANIVLKEYLGIQSLYLTIDLSGYVTCWHKLQAEASAAIFRSLQLKRLNTFIVIVLGDRRKVCDQSIHDEDTHSPKIEFAMKSKKKIKTAKEARV